MPNSTQSNIQTIGSLNNNVKQNVLNQPTKYTNTEDL